MIYILPEKYVEPDAPAKVELTTQQRTALKTKMQTYLNNKGVPASLKELVEDAHAYVLAQTGKHIHDSVFKEVALEIQNEWHPPVTE